jgi:hypothetical protein
MSQSQIDILYAILVVSGLVTLTSVGRAGRFWIVELRQKYSDGSAFKKAFVWTMLAVLSGAILAESVARLMQG